MTCQNENKVIYQPYTIYTQQFYYWSITFILLSLYKSLGIEFYEALFYQLYEINIKSVKYRTFYNSERSMWFRWTP